MERKDQFRVQPLWLFLAVYGIVLVLGVCVLLGLSEASYLSAELRNVALAGYVPICIYYIPRCVWGYGLDREFFTVYILWFPVQRIPWSEVSEVIYIHLGKEAQEKSATWKKEYICVTIKPAEPVPFFTMRNWDGTGDATFY